MDVQAVETTQSEVDHAIGCTSQWPQIRKRIRIKQSLMKSVVGSIESWQHVIFARSGKLSAMANSHVRIAIVRVAQIRAISRPRRSAVYDPLGILRMDPPLPTRKSGRIGVTEHRFYWGART